jgi:hypothetical protein
MTKEIDRIEHVLTWVEGQMELFDEDKFRDDNYGPILQGMLVECVALGVKQLTRIADALEGSNKITIHRAEAEGLWTINKSEEPHETP